MRLSDFNYNLPPELIAQHPLPDRTASRLLELGVDAGGQTFIQDKQFIDVINLIQANDLLVFNDTKVIPARLFGKKESGGAVEVLLERVTGTNTAITQIRASKSPKPGSVLQMGSPSDPFSIEVIGRHDHEQSPFFEVRKQWLARIRNLHPLWSHISYCKIDKKNAVACQNVSILSLAFLLSKSCKTYKKWKQVKYMFKRKTSFRSSKNSFTRITKFSFVN
mgnify:CR=1 FL=1